MNTADNKGATVAVDSLINYEAVKVNLLFLSCERVSSNLRLVLQQREVRS